MSDIWAWLAVIGLAVAFNITPIFSPPTVALLGYFNLSQGLGVLPLSLAGAVGSTAGKMMLAYLSRWLGGKVIPAERRAGIDGAIAVLETRRSVRLSYLALFAIGPIPRTTLFVAVGMARLPLVPGAIVFGITRFGFYLVALLLLDTAAPTLDDVLKMPFAGPLAIIFQIVSLAVVILFFRYDWGKLVAHSARLSAFLARLRAKLRIPQSDHCR